MSFLFIYIEVVARGRGDIGLIILDKYNYYIIVGEVLCLRYFSNACLLIIYIAVVVITMLTAVSLYIFKLGKLELFNSYLLFTLK